MKSFFKKGMGKKAAAFVMVLCIIGLTAVMLNVFKYYIQTQPAFSQPIHRGSEDSKAIAFTCNIDWGNEYIPGMLDLFDTAGIEAAFFITGRWAEKNQELARLIAQKGHIIGNHGYSHRDHSKLDYSQNKYEIDKTQQILQQTTGKSPKYFAPPSGAYNSHTVKAANDLGCEVILWSIDTIDWKRDGVDKILSRVDKKLHGGGIVLMHPTDQTLEALPDIIMNIRNRDYEILSLEQIVNSIEK